MSNPHDPKHWERFGDVLAEIVRGDKPPEQPPEVLPEPPRIPDPPTTIEQAVANAAPEVPAPDAVWVLIPRDGCIDDQIRSPAFPSEVLANRERVHMPSWHVVRYVRGQS